MNHPDVIQGAGGQTEFGVALTINILETIAGLRKQGTTAMSIENLLQVTRVPHATLKGAPKGRLDYQTLFRAICESRKSIRSFLL